MTDLLAFIDDHQIGHVRVDRRGMPQFGYEPNWRDDPQAVPLSLSLPLAAEAHAPEKVEAVLWGLLPDNEHTLRRWATRFKVSARNPVALLSHVGMDCAGAVSFVRPEQRESWLERREDGVDWIDPPEIGRRLARLREDSGAGREPDDLGQFSLAGAQPKLALLELGGQWGIPRGRIPTTHILKPPTGDYDGFAENEHFCLMLARAAGLPAAASEVRMFGEEVAICVTRFDRALTHDGFARIHQEDACQALGVHPQRKYENEGGPSVHDVHRLLRNQSSRPRVDGETFVRALGFNWFIAGSDAHAKNYSLLLGQRGHVRLAPLYDLISALPYPRPDRRRVSMAMKIGSHYRWWDIGGRDWTALARDAGMPPEAMFAILHDLGARLPDLASTCARDASVAGLHHPIVDRLVDAIADATSRCLRLLEIATRPARKR